MAYIGEEFQKRYKTLPEDIQNALTAVASVDTIFAIGKKHGLMVDQIGTMADEIWKVMLGLTNPKDFIRNLASAVGIESEKASAIAGEVNAQMFQMVRESLRKIYDSSTPPAAPVTPPSPSSDNPLNPPYFKGEEQGVPHLKVRGGEGELSNGARGVIEKEERELLKSQVPSMIYPQDRFEEPVQMSDLEGRTKEEPGLPAKSSANAGQLAPLVPTVTPQKTSEEELLYPEKMKEVSREPASPAGGPAMGGYKGLDPYREPVE